MKTYLLCAAAVLAVGARAEGQDVKKSGWSGDFACVAESTVGYPGNVEYASAFFYGRLGYAHNMAEGASLYAEGQFGQGDGVGLDMFAALPPLTLWGVSELPYDTFGFANIRQAYFQASVRGAGRLVVGKADLSEMFGPDVGGRSMWTGFVAPGLVTDPLVPFPEPGFTAYYGTELSPSTSVRCAYGDPAPPYWDDVFHKSDGFYIAELEQKLGTRDRIRVAVWAGAQVSEWDPGQPAEVPIGVSVDSLFHFGSVGAFFRLGYRPSELYERDLALSAGMTYQVGNTGTLGLACLATPWSQEYLDSLASTYGLVGEIQFEVFYRAKVLDALEIIVDAQMISCPAGLSRDLLGAERDLAGVASIRAYLPF